VLALMTAAAVAAVLWPLARATSQPWITTSSSEVMNASSAADITEVLICGSVTCDSSMIIRKSSGKKSSRQ
jgi:hypothetical protein